MADSNETSALADELLAHQAALHGPAFMRYIITQLDSVNAKLNDIQLDNGRHRSETASMRGDIEKIKNAFPKDDSGNPDIEGHHQFHWKLVESSKSWREIWFDVKKKIAGGVAWAVIVFLGWAIWSEIKRRAQQ